MSRCFHCGQAVSLLPGERVHRRDTCSSCGSDLHVCRNCSYYEPGRHNDCREPQSDPVQDKERANFCDYFQLGDAAQGSHETDQAKAALEALFKK